MARRYRPNGRARRRSAEHHRPDDAAARCGRGMLRAVSSVDRVRLRLDRVRAAIGEIDPAFLDTPALLCAPLGHALGCSVTLKVETLNPIRCFKGRGTETVAAVAREAGASRVVCASAGNLGQALAYSGRRRGLRSRSWRRTPRTR